MDDGKYLDHWKRCLPVLKILLKKSLNERQVFPFTKNEFDAIGDRPLSGYTFNLEIEKGNVVNDISGTAVARDLFKALNTELTIKKFLNEHRIKISLNKSFKLNIQSN